MMASQRFVRHFVNAVVYAALVFAAHAGVAAEAALTFQREGQAIPLAASDSTRIIQEIEALAKSANFDSVHQPGGFKPSDFRAVSEIIKDSFLRVHYSEPVTISTMGGDLVTQDIWIDIRPPRGLPGPTYLEHEGKLICLGKESGTLAIGLSRDPSIYPHLPQQMQKSADSGR